VAIGTDRSHSARKAFEEIVGSVEKTAASIDQIAASAAEQEGVSRKVVGIIEEMIASTGAAAA
jgi:methyl-accepting chemotaxis protein